VSLGSGLLAPGIMIVSTAAAQQQGAVQQSTDIGQALAIGLPITAGIVGYFLTYWNDWRLEKRKGELKFVSDQLQYLYGPVFALNSAGGQAVDALLKRRNNKGFFLDATQRYGEEEIREYRLWMSEVFMPINIRIEKVITENAHLIEGTSMPASFGDMLAHVASYKAVMKTWPDNPPKGEIDHEEALQKNTALLPFPRAFPGYVTKMFNDLKERQAKLLGLIGQKAMADSAGTKVALANMPTHLDPNTLDTPSSSPRVP
jgi:hypothetical protein